MNPIEVTDLKKTFGSLKAVDGTSFTVQAGEVFGLLGPNGAGKTTTIRMLACLIAPTAGSAYVGGYSVYDDPEKVRQSVGILTENPSLYERLTAHENLDFFADAYGLVDTQERHTRIRELLEFFNLWDRRNDKVGTFSKGMKQKLAIIRATVHRPPLLFLAEPTAGLAPESAKEIRDLMARLSQKEKCTILLCTHHLEDAEKLCKRVMIMNKGKCIIIGSPDELREKISGLPWVEIKLRKMTPEVETAVKTYPQKLAVNLNEKEATVTVQVADAWGATPELVQAIVNAAGQILSVNVQRPSLEEAYLKLVKEPETQ
jgi:ABC-2 type transport system ATP-binding protein